MNTTLNNLSQTKTVVKEKVSLNDGLPKLDPRKVVEELKSVLYSNDNFKRYFPDDVEGRFRANFNLFDRDGDERINLQELNELLVSIGQIFEQQELEELFEELQEPDGSGMRPDNLFILVSKKIRDNDKEEQLIEGSQQFQLRYLQKAFKTVDNEDSGYINEEMFKELLMSMGLRWSEEDADECLKFLDPKFGDPKGEGKFLFMDAVKKILK